MQSHCQVPGDPLHIVIRTSFYRLGAEVDFADQSFAEVDEDALLDALQLDYCQLLAGRNDGSF
jgi:hypothetical protein